MRWLLSVSLASLVALAGCSSDEKQQDPPPPPSQKATATKPKTEPKVAVKPAEEDPADSSPIVIKGSKHSNSADASSREEKKSNQAKIDELNRRAKDSQGKDNGDAYRESSGAPAGALAARRRDIKAQIDGIDQQVKGLTTERATLMEEVKTRQGRMMVNKEVPSDPERVKQIDSQIGELQKQKQALQAESAELDRSEAAAKAAAPPAGTAPPSDAPPAGTPPAGTTPAPGTVPPAGNPNTAPK